MNKKTAPAPTGTTFDTIWAHYQLYEMGVCYNPGGYPLLFMTFSIS